MSDEPLNAKAPAFVPITRDDVDDLHLLPRRFDLFVREMRQSFELLTSRIVEPMTRIAETVTDLKERVSELERAQRSTDDRLAALERSAIAKAG